MTVPGRPGSLRRARRSSKLATLIDVGLGYAPRPVGDRPRAARRSAPGARPSSKRDTGHAHPRRADHRPHTRHPDAAAIPHRLRDAGNTVLVIEHNLDVVKTADWVIDLGPEGGDGGGRIIAAGTPEKISQTEESFTGQYLAGVLTKPNVRTILTPDEPGSAEQSDPDQGRADPRRDPRRGAQGR
jgi:excinuclease ABC subunit A